MSPALNGSPFEKSLPGGLVVDPPMSTHPVLPSPLTPVPRSTQRPAKTTLLGTRQFDPAQRPASELRRPGVTRRGDSRQVPLRKGATPLCPGSDSQDSSRHPPEPPRPLPAYLTRFLRAVLHLRAQEIE